MKRECDGHGESECIANGAADRDEPGGETDFRFRLPAHEPIEACIRLVETGAKIVAYAVHLVSDVVHFISDTAHLVANAREYLDGDVSWLQGEEASSRGWR